MACNNNDSMAATWNGKLNGTMEPVVREYVQEDLAEALYVLLLEAVEDLGSDFGAFTRRAESLRPDRLRHELDLCDRLIVATDLHTGCVIGIGGVSQPIDRKGEYWHIALLSALDHGNGNCVIRKLLSELEG